MSPPDLGIAGTVLERAGVTLPLELQTRLGAAQAHLMLAGLPVGVQERMRQEGYVIHLRAADAGHSFTVAGQDFTSGGQTNYKTHEIEQYGAASNLTLLHEAGHAAVGALAARIVQNDYQFMDHDIHSDRYGSQRKPPPEQADAFYASMKDAVALQTAWHDFGQATRNEGALTPYAQSWLDQHLDQTKHDWATQFYVATPATVMLPLEVPRP